jgi:hypothetical protein
MRADVDWDHAIGTVSKVDQHNQLEYILKLIPSLAGRVNPCEILASGQQHPLTLVSCSRLPLVPDKPQMQQTYRFNVRSTVTEFLDRFTTAGWLAVLVSDFPTVGGQV